MPVRYDKLVRDRIPEIIQSHGHHPVTRVLDDATYQVALLAKLAEETREAQEAATEDLPAELADVLEVIRALAAAVGVS
jgi:predicted house-cleaning noncanonical NTP pyrophosphatase (MazG superfamily)